MSPLYSKLPFSKQRPNIHPIATFFRLSVAISEQHLLDCVAQQNGLNSGSHARALIYIRDHGAVRKYKYRRYTAAKGFCTGAPKAVLDQSLLEHVRVFISSDETVLQAAVALVGPVAVTFTATEHFRFYKSGVYRDPFCEAQLAPKHSALVVGYGTDGIMGDFWIVKNSFGQNWGEKYIRMARNSNKHCGIASFFSSPTENLLV